MEQEKIKESPGLKRWAAVENLKNIAESYNDAGSIMELEQKLSDISTECKSAKNDLLQTEKRLKSLMEILKYAEQYQATLHIIMLTKKQKIVTAISANMKVKSFFMAVQNICWNSMEFR